MRPPDPARAATFDALRARLTRIAYRMLGSVADAEDVVQDADLRWHGADRDAVRNPRSVPGADRDAALPRRAEVRPSSSRNLCRALAARAPRRGAGRGRGSLGRGHPVSDAGAGEPVAAGAGRFPPARHLRRPVRGGRPRHRARPGHLPTARQPGPGACEGEAPALCRSPDQGRAIAEAFFAASQSGDVEALQRLLSADATLVTDGGKAPAALNPIEGRARIARFFAGIARKLDGARARFLGFAVIDGLPGYLSVDPHGTLQATALLVEDGRIAAVYVTRNPDKLGHACRLFGDGGPAAAGFVA